MERTTRRERLELVSATLCALPSRAEAHLGVQLLHEERDPAQQRDARLQSPPASAGMRAPGLRDLGRLEALHSGHEHRCPDEQPHLSAKLLQAHVLHSELREELEQLVGERRASSVQLLLDLGDEIVHRDEPLLFLLNRGHPTFCYHVEDGAAPFPLVVAEQTTLR